MSEKKRNKPELKEITVEDLAKIIGGTEDSNETPGFDVEYPQRKSAVPPSKIVIGKTPGNTISMG